MTTRPDFTVAEKLDMEHLAEEMAVMVIFTPEYHCEVWIMDGVLQKRFIVTYLWLRSDTLMCSPSPREKVFF
jgi:hypothetical protein